MKRMLWIGLLAALLLCTACGRQEEQRELSRVVFYRGHGSTWGSQFRMEVCPEEVSHLYFFRNKEQDRSLVELFALPLEEAQWEQIETATMELLPLLQEKKPPSLIKRLLQAIGPKEVDGGKWWSLTLTWMINGESKDVAYIWPTGPEAEAFEQMLEEMAQSFDE